MEGMMRFNDDSGRISVLKFDSPRIDVGVTAQACFVTLNIADDYNYGCDVMLILGGEDTKKLFYDLWDTALELNIDLPPKK